MKGVSVNAVIIGSSLSTGKIRKIEFAGSLPRCGCVHKFKWKCSAHKLNCYSTSVSECLEQGGIQSFVGNKRFAFLFPPFPLTALVLAVVEMKCFGVFFCFILLVLTVTIPTFSLSCFCQVCLDLKEDQCGFNSLSC